MDKKEKATETMKVTPSAKAAIDREQAISQIKGKKKTHSELIIEKFENNSQ